MKLRFIGYNDIYMYDGIVLTPEEYKNHESYHRMIIISGPCLFIHYPQRERQFRWEVISVKCGNGLALLDATDEERKKLIDAGYKMLNLTN